MMSKSTNCGRPQHVGILAMDMYFPRAFVSQSDLEKADGCVGKYTVGLGQNSLSFVDDREDINSVLMSAMHGLLDKYNIDPSMVGRLEVGTETLIDKSKSAKTCLMPLLGSNTDVEGVTSYNACYGGSAALFNAVAWVESSEWDGRYALVVCGDIAVYAEGPARPTGGCGAVAMLIGPDAPLAMEPGLRSTHSRNVYDFYKPNHSEYAEVDGRLSQAVYLESVDACYSLFKEKEKRRALLIGREGDPGVSLDSFAYVSLHSPYNKLVQKGFTRMCFNDFLADPSNKKFEGVEDKERWKAVDPAMTYADRELDVEFRKVSAADFQARAFPACRVSREIGNSYTASVFAGLVSVVEEKGELLCDERVLMFSYGSGFMATAYSFVGRKSGGSFSLDGMRNALGVRARLLDRVQHTPQQFSEAMSLREGRYGKAGYLPTGSIADLFPGTYYLVEVNDKHHRRYEQAGVYGNRVMSQQPTD